MSVTIPGPTTPDRGRPGKDGLTGRRVVVVGTSGAGKTTLARALAQMFDLRHVELDALHWGPNWTGAPAEVFRAEVRRALEGSSWVCDGNYAAVRDIVWCRAEVLVWLNYSFRVVFSRAVRRTMVRLVTRETLFAGNRESLGSSGVRTGSRGGSSGRFGGDAGNTRFCFATRGFATSRCSSSGPLRKPRGSWPDPARTSGPAIVV